MGKRLWDYEPISITGYSEDESRLKPDIRIARKGRQRPWFEGSIDWNYDPAETDTVETKVWRSQTGSEYDYVQMPYAVPATTFPDALKNLYKNMVVDNFGHCMQLPDLGEKPQLPIPWAHYVIDACVLTGTHFPERVPDGHYKIVVTFRGDFTWSLTIVAKIFQPPN
ncbi:uncharacterized protein LOC117134763 [Drosophila busckii]|uniref:uncharacterized protein LOC117134763 n=1 Tax=Drosophila busckii TaxID=30019 RepID=UPI0014334391|nr:uncharacterized protein LOC117134763 [Drosophila busckii]